MPVMPVIHTATPNAIRAVNTIRENGSANLRAVMPVASANNVREIGTVLLGSPAVANEFFNSLLNRIARVVITSRVYSNPLAFFKKGYLELGETVEEIFVDLIQGYKYDAETGAELLHKRRVPDVKACYHIQNFAAYYPVTINRSMIRKAFVTWAGVEDLISKIIEKVYTSYAYDEFEIMKYMLAKSIVNGEIPMVNNVVISAQTADAAVTTIKGISNEMEFMSANYNSAGVRNLSKKDDQYLVLTAQTDAVLDVNSLSKAFNMEYVQFLGHKTTVDKFWNLDDERLSKLFSDENTGISTFVPLTSTEKGLLENVTGLILDRDFLQIYDTEDMFAENFNGNNMEWNYFYHRWGIFSYSLFNNAVAFTSGAAATISTVSAAVVSKTATDAYTILTFKPEVTATGLSEKNVKFVQTADMTAAGITMTDSGVMTIPANADGVAIQITVNGIEYDSGETEIDATTVVGAEVEFSATEVSA